MVWWLFLVQQDQKKTFNMIKTFWSCCPIKQNVVDLVASWSCESWILWRVDLVASWSCGKLILWQVDLVASWSCGKLILWQVNLVRIDLAQLISWELISWKGAKGREGGRERGREGGRDRWREGGRREEGREGGKEGGTCYSARATHQKTLFPHSWCDY